MRPRVVLPPPKPPKEPTPSSIMSERSEERRVGKECRSRCDWSSDVCSSDLRNPVGVDITHADAAEGRVAPAEAAEGTDSEQHHVGEDRIRGEQTDIAPDLDRAPALVAEGEEVLPQIDGGDTEACFTGGGTVKTRVE